jgi:hypothetical protein
MHAESESVSVWICVFGINVMLHHIIASSRIALHHTSCRINSKNRARSKPSAVTWWMKVCRSTKQTLGNYDLIRKFFVDNNIIHCFVIEGLFPLRSMKKGKMFFRQRLKNGMYANFMHRKEIYYINIHIDIQCLTCKHITSHKCWIF